MLLSSLGGHSGLTSEGEGCFVITRCDSSPLSIFVEKGVAIEHISVEETVVPGEGTTVSARDTATSGAQAAISDRKVAVVGGEASAVEGEVTVAGSEASVEDGDNTVEGEDTAVVDGEAAAAGRVSAVEGEDLAVRGGSLGLVELGDVTFELDGDEEILAGEVATGEIEVDT